MPARQQRKLENDPQNRIHDLSLDSLIVHKYADSPALIRKADKIAREIIAGELRDGEHVRVLGPGLYARLDGPKGPGWVR